MALDFSPISFPWEMVGQAQQMRNQNQQNFQQNLAGMGTGLGNIANAAAKYKALGIIQQALANQRGQTGAPLPPGTQGPQMPTPDFTNQPGVLPAMMVLNPEAGSKALMSQFDPSLQSEIGLRLSESAKNRMEMAGGLPTQQAALAEAARAHQAEEQLRQIAINNQNFQMDEARRARERAAMQDEQTRADKLRSDIREKNWKTLHLWPYHPGLDKQIDAIKGPMDPGYTGPPQIQRKILNGKLYTNYGSGWLEQ